MRHFLDDLLDLLESAARFFILVLVAGLMVTGWAAVFVPLVKLVFK